MINITFGFCTYICFPLFIGTCALLSARVTSPEIAKDEDIFFSTCSFFYIFIISLQGWKLDPILIFSQFLVILIILGLGLENLRLRLLIKDIQHRNMDKLSNKFR